MREALKLLAPRRLDAAEADFERRFAGLVEESRDTASEVDQTVAEILATVRAQGDAALVDYTRRLDRFPATIETLRISAAEIDQAVAEIPAKTRAALELAALRITAFHRSQMPADHDMVDAAGVRLGWRWRPIEAVGLYVPGGTASYPSSVLMNALPAKVAGVDRLVMVVPTPDGILNPLVLAAARLAGVDEIYRIGGAQAVAALAYGTALIAPVDRIVGPGNAYVAEAKRQVFGRVGIDSIAGPSNVVIFADAGNDPAYVALDLLAQAEHDEDAQAILVTNDAALAEAVLDAVKTALATLPRAAIAGESWRRHGAVILVRDWEEAVALANRVAPEHLQLMLAEPGAVFQKIRHAGAVFLGANTPEAIGDYVAGPNHVLPTSGTARFSSGLSVYDFLKRTTWVSLNDAALQTIGPAAVALAEAENLSAHGRSVAIRLPKT